MRVFMSVFLMMAICLLFASQSNADSSGVLARPTGTLYFKGSVGNGATKAYGPFYVTDGGTALIHLSYDNKATDLDVGIAVRNTAGELVLMGLSASDMYNMERIDFGVFPGTWYLVIDSYRGGSGFRASLECSCLTTTSAAAGQATGSATELHESPMTPELQRLVDAMEKKSNSLAK